MPNIYEMTDEWNNPAEVFTAIKMDVTNTASAAGNKLLDLRMNDEDVFSVDFEGGYATATLHFHNKITGDNGFTFSHIGEEKGLRFDAADNQFVPMYDNNQTYTKLGTEDFPWGSLFVQDQADGDHLILFSLVPDLGDGYGRLGFYAKDRTNFIGIGSPDIYFYLTPASALTQLVYYEGAMQTPKTSSTELAHNQFTIKLPGDAINQPALTIMDGGGVGSFSVRCASSGIEQSSLLISSEEPNFMKGFGNLIQTSVGAVAYATLNLENSGHGSFQVQCFDPDGNIGDGGGRVLLDFNNANGFFVSSIDVDDYTLSGFGFDFNSGQLKFFDAAENDFVAVMGFTDGELTVQGFVVSSGFIANSGYTSVGFCYLMNEETYTLTATTNWLVTPPANRVNISSSAAYEIRGMHPATICPLYLHNSGSFNITFKHNSTSSENINGRILSTTGADIVLTPGRVLQLVYVNTRWRAWLC